MAFPLPRSSKSQGGTRFRLMVLFTLCCVGLVEDFGSAWGLKTVVLFMLIAGGQGLIQVSFRAAAMAPKGKSATVRKE